MNNFKKISKKYLVESLKNRYSYNFKFRDIPIIQYPQDLFAFQEIIWNVKPDLIIETGVAHGGSLLYFASMMHLLNLSGSKTKKRTVIGIELELRKKNEIRLAKDKLSKYIRIIKGSSVSVKTIKKVENYVSKSKNILVILDSNHSEKHVLEELNIYSKFVTSNSYCVVMDTIIEFMPKNFYKNRNWNVGNNPYTAVKKFLKTNTNFRIDKKIENKLGVTAAINGYLKKVKK